MGSVACLAHHVWGWWEVKAGSQSWDWNVCGLGCAFTDAGPLPSSSGQLRLKLGQGSRSPAPV